MNTQLVTRDSGEIAEAVIAKGDLAKLTPSERTSYYQAVCESVGLNPLTQPLAYITLNGKLTLYALRGATDQLRAKHNVSVVEMSEAERDGVYIVTVKVRNADGRTDMARGAVTIGNLKGDALANAMMKAETKAKRRATLSICGLGMLDETEVETVPSAVPQRSSHRLKQEGGDDVFKSLVEKVREAQSVPDLQALHKQYATTIASWPAAWQETFAQEVYDPRLAEMQDARRSQPRTKALSDDDSAKVRETLLGLLHQCADASEIQEWRDGNLAAFKSMTKADQQAVVRERDARLAELFNASSDDDQVDADGVLMAG